MNMILNYASVNAMLPPTITAVMKYFYGQFNGDAFPTPDSLFSFDNLMEFILQYGEQALKAIEQMLKDPTNEQQSDLLEQLLKDGMLDKDGKGKVRLTPRAIG